jgi:hypothetical protein
LLSGTQFGDNYQLPLSTTNQITWLDANTPWSISTIVTAPSGTEQWVSSAGTSGNVTGAITINPIYVHQYYLTVISPAPANIATSGSGWYNAGSTAYAGLASGTVPYGTGAQWVFAGWTTGGNNYQQSNAITMNSASTAIAVWNLQYFLTVTSAYGSPSGSGWYNSGTSAYVGVSAGTVAGGTGTQYVFSSWSGNASGSNYAQSNAITMNSPLTATANWQTQYYLTVTSSYGSPSGAGWYNSGASASFGVSTPASGGTGIQYVFVSYSGSGSGSYSGASTSTSVTMNNPIIETAIWQQQYYLTVSSSYGTPSGSGWYSAGSTAYAAVNSGTVSGVSGTQYIFTSWSSGGSNYAQSSSITMNAPITATASWIAQYYLTVNSAYGVPSGSGWYNSGVTAYAGLNTGTVSGGTDTQYVFSFWSTSGTNYAQSNGIPMNAPETTTASWITQYQITFAVNGDGSTSPTGSNVWENSGSLPITATPNSGYTFSSWSSNTGSITFDNVNSASATATISGTGTITATFALTPTPTPTPTPLPIAAPTSAPTPNPTSTPSPTPTPTSEPTATPSPTIQPAPTPAIPEFPSIIILALLVTATFAIAVEYKRKNP